MSALLSLPSAPASCSCADQALAVQGRHRQASAPCLPAQSATKPHLSPRRPGRHQSRIQVGLKASAVAAASNAAHRQFLPAQAVVCICCSADKTKRCRQAAERMQPSRAVQAAGGGTRVLLGGACRAHAVPPVRSLPLALAHAQCQLNADCSLYVAVWLLRQIHSSAWAPGASIPDLLLLA